MMRWWWCCGLVSLALALGCAPMAFGAASKVPGVTPQLRIQTLAGSTFDLAAERGKWVIVNFWATWCSPCLAEMPAISKYVAGHADVTAIGLAYQPEPAAVVEKFAREHPVDYPLARVDTDHPPTAFPVPQTLPTTYLIAPDGQIAKRFIGPINAQLLDAAIASRRPLARPHAKD